MKTVLETLPQTNLFELIFQSIEEGVFTTDFEFKITSFNRAAEEITGFSRDQAISQRCFDIFRTDHCQKQCALRNTLTKGIPVKNVRVNILTREGVTKPISVSTSILRGRSGETAGAVEIFRDLSSIEELRRQMTGGRSFESLVSRNREMHDIFELLPDVAQSECNVLIQGPSGSGKELIARALHNLSPRKENPYIRVNCAALPSTLLESELFGYMKGAFTDARRDKPGRFLQADGGTILLDEIGEMSVALQAKLLRVLQEGEIQPLGSTKTLSVDARVIASTNQSLKDMVEKGLFREDLYYRMNVITIELPPLARRREDVPILIDHFIQKMRLKTGKEIQQVSDDVLERLMQYHFPGNVRELENIIEHAFVLCKSDTIDMRHLPRYMLEMIPGRQAELDHSQHFLDYAEKRILEEKLKECGGNKVAAAQQLGIHRTTLWRKLKKYHLK
ncbi:MAG: sigma 54-interacting transcriptional regulator [Candidatus Omnitrophica bacterium]|nr:sigma 54-interacting transcriptional regulator [Candidatus Omnitrophota bacterium]